MVGAKILSVTDQFEDQDAVIAVVAVIPGQVRGEPGRLHAEVLIDLCLVSDRGRAVSAQPLLQHIPRPIAALHPEIAIPARGVTDGHTTINHRRRRQPPTLKQVSDHIGLLKHRYRRRPRRQPA